MGKAIPTEKGVPLSEQEDVPLSLPQLAHREARERVEGEVRAVCRGALLPSVGTNMQPVPVAVCMAASPAGPWVRDGSGCSAWRDILLAEETGALTPPTALNPKAFGQPGDKNK